MKRVRFDLGHTGKTRSGSRNLGAVHTGFHEVRIVRAYVASTCSILEAHGIIAEIDGVGRYSRRQSRATVAEVDAFMPCHVNAGWQPGYRGAAFYKPESHSSEQLAGHCVRAIAELTGSGRKWKTSADDWTKRAHSLVAYTGGGVPAVVFEPVFVDCPDHKHLLENPRLIGEALARAVLDFLDT